MSALATPKTPWLATKFKSRASAAASAAIVSATPMGGFFAAAGFAHFRRSVWL
jgi:hypothetical protein